MRMNSLTLLAAATILVAGVSWSHAQQTPSANELVVEASRLIRSAESATTPEQAISLLEEAYRQLVLITEVHPSSDMAVKLATGQGIGTISLAGVQAAIKAAAAKCWTSLSLLCGSRLTLDAVMSDEFKVDPVGTLITIATAQIKAGAPENARATFKRAIDTAVSEGQEYLFGSISEAQAEVGQFSDAVRTAELIENIHSRTAALLDIATVQSKAGHGEEAQLLIDKVIAAAASIDDADDRAGVFARIASVQAEAGQFDAAVESATSISNAKRRTNTLLAVAAIQRKSGNGEEARTTTARAASAARAIRYGYDRASVLCDVAAAYIDVGDAAGARATIDAAVTTVSDMYALHQALTLTAVAAAQTKAGNIREARVNIRQAANIAKSIQDSNQRTGRLKAVVSVGIEAEQFIEAAQVAELLNDSSDRALALADIASAQVKAGKARPAGVTIEMADDFAKVGKKPFEYAHAQALIANVRTASGDITDRTTTDMVVEAAQSLQDAYDRTRLFALVSLAQFEAGHSDDAQATIKLADDPAIRIEDPAERAHTLALVAKAYANGGFDSARETIARAVEAAISLEDTGRQATRLREMASAYAEVGHFTEAVATAMLIKATRVQVQTLATVASKQVELGATKDAQKTIAGAAATAKSNGVDAQVLATIAAVQAEAGLAEAAQATFRDAFQDIESRAYWYPGYVLAEVAVAQATAGQSEDARTTIDRAVVASKSERASWRALALTAIATAQTKAGDAAVAQQTLATAFEVAKAIEVVQERLQRFFEVASAQEQAGNAEGVRVTIDTTIKHFRSAKKDEDLARTFLYGFDGVPLQADQLAEVIAIVNSPEFANAFDGDGLFHLGMNLARKGLSKSVMEVLKLIEVWHWNSVLRSLISSQVQAAQFTEAIKTARLIEDPSERITPLVQIVLARARGGNIAEAQATISLVTEAVEASGSDVNTIDLARLAEAQAGVGLVVDAKSTLRDALQSEKSSGRFSGYSLARVLAVILKMHEASQL